MTVPYGNCAAPHGDPMTGFLDQFSGRSCGTCPAAPRYWKLQTIGNPPSSTNNFFAQWNIQSFTDDGFIGGGTRTDDSTTVLMGITTSAWFNFENVAVPAGATINSAHLSVIAEGSSGATIALLVNGAASSNQAEPTVGDYATIPRTAASANWSIVAPSMGTTYAVDVTAIVQEIVSAGYWASGGSIMLFSQDNGSMANFAANGLDSHTTPPLLATTLSIGWTVTVNGNNPTAYQKLFLQPTLLTRELADFTTQPAADCLWESALVDLFPATGDVAASRLWTLFYGTAGSQGINRWYVIANGLPANAGGSGLPADVVVYDFLGSVGNPGPGDHYFFRCLEPNTFFYDDGNTDNSGNLTLPIQLTVTPFWP